MVENALTWVFFKAYSFFKTHKIALVRFFFKRQNALICFCKTQENALSNFLKTRIRPPACLLSNPNIWSYKCHQVPSIERDIDLRSGHAQLQGILVF